MNLDEIIQLSRGQIYNQLPGQPVKKRKRQSISTVDGDCNHSVPLLPPTDGVGIYVSRKSSLLNAEHRRWVTQAVSSSATNRGSLNKSKMIIPAEYKLFGTEQGVERILVPARERFPKQFRKKLLPPRKLNRTSVGNEGPPPLVSAPIYNPPPTKPAKNLTVDKPGVDFVTSNIPASKKPFNVIDFEFKLPMDIVEARKLCSRSFRRGEAAKTLSERFTMLPGSFRF